MKITKRIARQIIFPALVNTGLEKSIRMMNGNSMLNILYHGVVPKPDIAFSPRHFSVEQFEKQLKYFVNEFDIISLPTAFHRHKEKIKSKRKTITISFDDGYKNNLLYALPILEKYNIPVTFFISGTCALEMERRILWPDVIACLSFYHRNEVIQVGDLRFNGNSKTEHLPNISDYIKTLGPAERDDFFSLLVNKYNLYEKLDKIPGEYWEIMDKKDIEKMASSKIVKIGSHGKLHYNLGNIALSEAEKEMVESKELLEKVIEKKVDMIAFPDGSYSDIIKDKAFEIGYDKQLAVNYKCANDPGDTRILNRHGLSPTTTYESNIFFLNKSFLNKGFN